MARSRKRVGPTPRRLVLDAGAVIALSRGDTRARAFLARAIEVGARVEIPVVVLAETLRGGQRDATVHRVIKAVDDVPPTTAAIGRLAGSLLGRARSTSTVDAMVVAQAALGGAHVLTGDSTDLEALAASHPEIWVHAL